MRLALAILLFLLLFTVCAANGGTHVLVKVGDVQIQVQADCFCVDSDGYLLLYREIDGDDWLVGIFRVWDYAYLVID